MSSPLFLAPYFWPLISGPLFLAPYCWPLICWPPYFWCNAEFPFSCTELEGKTATGKTFDPILCANQSFWEGRGCDEGDWRYTGDNPGQCWSEGHNKCTDGSSEIKLADEEQGCQDDLMCTARDGRWAGMKICLMEKFLCDNHIQCQDGVDEEGCEQQYLKKGIFRRDERYICKAPFLEISSEDNKKGKFFPKRAVRWAGHIYHHHACKICKYIS